MSNHTHLFTFNIESWTACALGLTEPQHWKEWAQHITWSTEGKIDASELPAMMRRRMSVQSKLSVQAALRVIKNQEIDYLVFSSRHGELHRTATLIESILQGEDASPMAFAQSVHNTAAGLTTIASKQSIPLTSIAAGEDTFHNALLDALLYLDENPNKKVLLVDFDQPLPSVYQQYESNDFSDYALAIVLSQGEQYSLARSTHQDNTPDVQAANPSLTQGLLCLQRIINNDAAWSIEGLGQTWHWNKHHDA
ncbi:3-oxoacyl-ACP synthase [Vibrio sp. T187]|uniref:beta-ketoacyl synthase chain length factor n=1 Tax=Vibrio TaxID=662 RepID=UPI0010C995CD|nr:MULTISPECIES: beta-ketoacyl synthase chain length factor [Vibrio]MBW3696330.1 3-oxoacyl-ACP synthase [Vibrio sp. T187]